MNNTDTERPPLGLANDTPPASQPSRLASPIVLAVALFVVGLGLAVALLVSIQGGREADARATRLETAQKAKDGGYRLWTFSDGSAALKTAPNAPPLEDLLWWSLAKATPEERAELLDQNPAIRQAYEEYRKKDGKFPPSVAQTPPTAPTTPQKPLQRQQGAKK